MAWFEELTLFGQVVALVHGSVFPQEPSSGHHFRLSSRPSFAEGVSKI